MKIVTINEFHEFVEVVGREDVENGGSMWGYWVG